MEMQQGSRKLWPCAGANTIDSLGATLFTVPRARHELLQLHVGDVGLVKEVYAETAMIKVMFPDLGTVSISWLEADCRPCADD